MTGCKQSSAATPTTASRQSTHRRDSASVRDSAFPVPFSLQSNFTWTFAANVVYAVCQWFILVLLTKLLSLSDVGVFSLGLALTAPVIMLANLQLRPLQATDVTGRSTLADYLQLRLITTFLALIVIVLLAGFQTHIAGAGIVIVSIGVSKAVEALSDVLHGAWQQNEQMVAIARSMILKGILSVLLVGWAAWIFATPVAAAFGLAASSILTLVLYDAPTTGRIRGALRPVLRMLLRRPSVRVLDLAWLAFPLGVVQGLASLSANVPRYFLERFSGPAELGVFSALVSLIVVGQTVVSALGNVISPTLARCYSNQEYSRFRKLSAASIGVGVALGVAGVIIASLFGDRILLLLFRREYAEQAHVLVTLMAGSIFAYTAWFAGFGLTAARALREQIPLLAATCLAAWIGSLVWVPKHGVNGAALAFLTSMAVQATGAIGLLCWRIRSGTEVLYGR